MGMYVFNARFLFEQLCLDATRPGSAHDFGHDIIPAMIDTHRLYRVSVPRRKPQARRLLAQRGHAGRLLRREHGPDLGRSAVEHVRRALADPHLSSELSAAEIRLCRAWRRRRRGEALDSIVCQGSIVSGGQVERSILGSNVRINSFAQVEDSILLDGVDIGRHARVRRAIIDKWVRIPPGTQIGFDQEQDRARGFTVSEGGVTVIAKADGAEHFHPELESAERAGG